MSFAAVSTVLAASPERAFQTLEDPKSFEKLVAGARHIRRFDPRWPDRGTLIHHTVGVPPLLVRDSTEVVEVEPPHFLRLEARLWPLGSLLVDFRLSPDPAGSRLVVVERPYRGPVGYPGVRLAVQAALRVRNAEICRRYRNLVLEREKAIGGDEHG